MTESLNIAQQIQLFLPKYLSPSQKEQLWAELSAFPENFPFYFNRSDIQGELLQGDGWRGFIAIQFETGNRKIVSAVILSNTCDISTANQRALPVRILFSPLVSLRRYTELLQKSGRSTAQINNIIGDIKKQRYTSLFYFPCPNEGDDEYIISLDDIHSHPVQDFLAQPDRKLLFRLSQTAFYLFLLKLSIHFSRFQEGISRFPD